MLIIIPESQDCRKHETRYNVALSSFPSPEFMALSLKATAKPHPLDTQLPVCECQMPAGSRLSSLGSQKMSRFLAAFRSQAIGLALQADGELIDWLCQNLGKRKCFLKPSWAVCVSGSEVGILLQQFFFFKASFILSLEPTWGLDSRP